MAKRTAQLAGLAALGALGYMLTRGKGGEGAPVETRSFSPNMLPSEAEPEVDTGDFLSRRLRVNPETGQAYSMDNLTPMGPATPRPAASRVAPVTPRAAADVASVDPANISDAVSRRTGVRLNSPAGPGRSAGVGGPTAAEIAAYEDEIAASRNPNISAEVARRTGVKLNSRAGAGRSAGRGGPTMAELAAYEASRAAGRRDNRFDLSTPEGRKRAEQAQALEGVYPETMVAAPGLKTVAGMARAAAARTGGRGAAEAAPFLRELPAPAGRAALPAPTARLTGPSQTSLKEAERLGRATARQEQMLRENAARYGLDPTAPGYEAAMRALRQSIGGGAFTVKKKGGAVKAKSTKMSSGGGTKSASRRGDGIAMRGKTRGKLY